jgi:acyl-CoA synthetase (AMP-forming)/AMP-acid ligase II
MSSSAHTLWAQWSENAAKRPDGRAIVHWRAGEAPFVWTWGALLSEASKLAYVLQQQGVRRGDVCALMLRHCARFYPLYFAVSAIGAIPSVLAYPNARLHLQKFLHGLSGMAKRSGLRWLLTERDLESIVAEHAFGDGSTVAGALYPLHWDTSGIGPADSATTRAGDVCLLQHSSGTTGLQKAVALSHEAVLTHVARYGRAIGLRDDDQVASWLPLYHDMGLIAAFHLPLAAGIATVIIDPFEWVSMPALLLQAMSSEQATLSWLPNFAFNFMADRVRDEEIADLSLHSTRMVINCSEPVRASSHDRFLARFERLGLRRSCLGASYAMAETTFAVTQTVPGVEARVLAADREELLRGRFVAATAPSSSRACVSSGAPIDGCRVAAFDPERRELPDATVGEIWIRSESMFDGYRNDPGATREAFQDGWYRSGDYGFRYEGEWFVIGRRKDIIIVAGKNLFPEDVEDAVSAVDGVLPGRVVAFGVDDESLGTENVCVVAETTLQDPAAMRALRLEILRAGMSIDVTIKHVYLAPPRWLIKSSSGKPSRAANRERIVSGTLSAE